VLIDIQRVMGIMQKMHSVSGSLIKNRLYKHLSDEIYAHYGNSILYAEGHWVSQ